MTEPTHTPHADRIALRSLGEADRAEVDRLAALDSSAPLRGTRLIGAEMDGRLIAAISVVDGATVADPFAPTAPAVELLRLRAAQLGAANARRPGRMRRLRDALGRGHARAGLAGSPPGAGGRLLQL